MAAAPTGDVTISVASDDTRVATVEPAVLVFTMSNWATAQTVTVTGAAAGATSVSHTVSGADYGSVSAPGVDVTVAARGVVVTPEAVRVDPGTTDTYTVVLATAPTGDVTITVASDDVTVASVDEVSLVFTTLNWDSAQTVTVTGAAPGTTTITHAVAGGDYGSVSAPGVAVGVRGVVVAPEAVTLDPNTTDTYAVVLASAPTGSVTISVASADTSVATVAPGVLTFTMLNWATAQTVTVTGEAPGTTTITHAVSGADYGANNVTAPDVVVGVRGVVVDPDALDVVVDAPRTYTVALAAAPTGDVTISVASDDTTVATVEPAVLVFTMSNWDTAQTVTVTGAAAGATSVSHTVLGADYGSVSAPGVDVTVAARGVVVTPEAVRVDPGTTDTYAVVLATAPTGDVTITVASDDVTVASVDEVSLVFTTLNWDSAQTVTVTGAAPGTTTITHAVAGGDYGSVSAPGVAVGVRGVVVAPEAVTLDPNTTDTYAVVLASAPTGSVTISVASADTSVATVAPGVLTFTMLNWATAQTVTVTGEAPGTTTITHAVSGADYGANNVTAPDVVVGVRGVVVDPDALDVVVDAPRTYTVALAAAPTGDVTISVASDDTTVATVEPAVLVFTMSNWDTAQTVTVTGAAAGATSVSHTVLGADYGSVSAPGVDVTVAARGVVVTPEAVRVDPGTTDTYAVVLATAPTGDVTITVASDDVTVASVDEVSLVFTTLNWDSAQTVTVTGAAPGTTTITHAVAGGDYGSVSAPGVAVGVRGVVVAPEAVTLDPNTTDTYAVVLASAPTGSVTISVASADTSVATVAPGVLTFTMLNWATAQTVTVTGEAPGTTTITHAVSGADYGANNVTAPDVVVGVRGVVVDPDALDVVVDAPRTYTVALAAAPTGDVTISVASDDTTVATVEPAVLVFTMSNWDTAQTVTVTGAAAGATSVSHTVLGADYGSVSAPGVDVTVAARGVVVTPEAVRVDPGTTDTYAVVLATAPTGDVTITVASDDVTVASVDEVSLVFTTLNWDSAQTVTVTGAAPGTTTITHAVAGGDYGSVSAPGVAVGVRGVVVAPEAVTLDPNTTDTYAVVLASAPTGSVTISVASGDTSVATVAPGVLTFTMLNWATAQTVTVTGEAPGTTTITHAVSGADYGANNVTAPDVVVGVRGVVVDPDALDVVVDAPRTYTVALAAAPTGDVTISVASDDTTVATVEPAVLVFTMSNWDTAQTVTVTGAAAGATSVSHTVLGADYGSVSAPGVDVTVAARGVVVTPEAVRVDPGTTDTYTVVLATAPTGDVTITVASDDVTVASVDEVSLVFTTLNWDSAQTVTVTGAAPGTTTITHAVAGGDYGSVSAPGVAVGVRGVVVAPEAVTLDPNTTDTYAVVLASAPTGSVTISVASADTSVATVAPGVLTFTMLNWATAQTVTVTGEAPGTTTITHAVSGADYGANNVTAPDVVVGVRGVVVDPDALDVVVDAPRTYTVALAAAPTGDVTISVASDDTTVATVEPAVLVFTMSNWDTAQTVTVTGAAAGATSVSHTVLGADYGSVSAPGVDVTVAARGVVVTPEAVRVDPGTTDTYAVVLATAPTGDVTITVASDDVTVASVDEVSLVFTTLNWDSAQTVTVTGAAPGTTTITHAVAGGDYGSVSAPGVAVGVRGVVVAPEAVTLDPNTTDTYAVVLASAPTGSVTISVASADTSVATVAPGVLTFTMLNWATAQTVTVTGEAPGTTTITHAVSGADYGANNVTAPDVVVGVRGVVVDPDALDVVVDAPRTYTVALAAAPTGDVTISVASDDTTVATVEPAVLVFTMSNWDTAQTVTVTGAAAGATSVSHTVLGADYGSVSAPGVDVTVAARGVVVTPEAVRVDPGTTDTYAVVLATAPTGDVTITVASDDVTVASVDEVSLVFTTLNWDSAQTVTVTGAAPGTTTITHAVAGGDYGSVSAPGVAVGVRGVVVAPEAVTLDPNTTDTYAVVLASAPTGSVTISVASADTSVATVAPGVLTFTMLNWATAQTVTVTGEAPGTTTITHAVSGADYGANNVTAPDVVVGVRGVVVDPDALDVVVDAPRTYTVALAAAPTGDVTISVASDDTTVATVEPAVLVFTMSNWATAQTVTVTGAAAGATSVSHTVLGADYGSVSAPGVDVTVAARGVVVTPEAVRVDPGTTDTYAVVLATAPTGDVTITVASDDVTVASVDEVSLVFTTLNWDSAQTVTVTGAAPGTTTITHAVAGGDYGSVSAPGVAVGVRGVVVAPEAVTLDPNTTDTYAVVLASAPTGSVTISVASADTSVATVAPGVLTFTMLNWATAQTVTVTGEAPGTTTITHAVSGADYGANNVTAPDVVVGVRGVVVDPDALDVVVDAPRTYTVALAAAPTGDVTISVASDDTTVATVEPAVLVFTMSNWATAQTVTVTGAAAGATSVSHTVLGADYGSVSAPGVDVTVAARGVVVTPEAVRVDPGTTDTYAVVLATAPTGDVTITVASDDVTVASVDEVSLVFTTLNWDSAQTVTVTGAAPGTTTITHAVAGGDYGSVSAPGVAVGVRGVVVAPEAVTLDPNTTDTYTVVLASAPTGSVTISVASADTSVATVAPGVLTFTMLNWDTAQTVTVTGQAAGTTTIAHGVSGGDYGDQQCHGAGRGGDRRGAGRGRGSRGGARRRGRRRHL